MQVDFAGIDKDIVKLFLSLSDDRLERIFEEYGELHGASALVYARRTYASWKHDKVRISGKIADRLFDLESVS